MKHAQPPASVLSLIETSYRSSLVNQPYPHVLVYDTKQKSRSNLHLPLKLLIQKQLHSFRPGCNISSRFGRQILCFSLARSASHSQRFQKERIASLTSPKQGTEQLIGQDSQPCLVGLNLVPDSPKIRSTGFWVQDR